MNNYNNQSDIHSLSHSKWNCKYHIVFAPKYRRKVFYEEKRLEAGSMLRELCNWKGVHIIAAEVCPDHVHMFLEIPPKMSVVGSNPASATKEKPVNSTFAGFVIFLEHCRRREMFNFCSSRDIK